jgi:hypothetical protein
MVAFAKAMATDARYSLMVKRLSSKQEMQFDPDISLNSEAERISLQSCPEANFILLRDQKFRWPSGEAMVCKTIYVGSNPTRNSLKQIRENESLQSREANLFCFTTKKLSYSSIGGAAT